MFSNANVEILLGDGNITPIRVYIYIIFIMFWANLNKNICT